MSTTPSAETAKYLNGRLWLQNEFARRRRKNPRFSVRAFAQCLELDSSTVSKVLVGKRKLSAKLITKICRSLNVDDETRAQLIDGLNAPDSAPKVLTETPVFRVLDEDAFATIADHHHTVIFLLCRLQGVKNDPAAIGSLIGFEPGRVSAAIERLMALELIEDRNGILKQKESYFSNEAFKGVTSEAHKEFQRQLLRRALDAIDGVPAAEKDITSRTMAVDPRRLPEAREMIKRFRSDLCAFMGQGRCTQVYNLGVQLVPLSKKVEP